MHTLTLADLHSQNLILLETVSGSRAYGLATPESDWDIKGVFYLPPKQYFSLHYTPQIANESNDIVYYELGRFVELLLASNPHALELLAAPTDCIRQRAPIMDNLRLDWFVSQACQHSFAGYALGQIKKARGLNKKINNPMSPEKKSLLDFCYIIQENDTIDLPIWLAETNRQPEKIGLAAVPHARNLFAVFYDEDGSLGYRGVAPKNMANSLTVSSIPPHAKRVAYLSFNQDGYSSYYREYASYWQWVRERNETRYQNNQAHQGGYDSKNMMHTFRLLQMARDIAVHGEIRVRRDNRDELLAIKQGSLDYETLLSQAEQLNQEVQDLFNENPCRLPEQVNYEAAECALIDMRRELYRAYFQAA
ncbi:DNA polymerase beta superfamily protein [Alysiella crassa]|uniref:Predicted nucleotidyltransferase n=1 Tax=Alysiella crassa TaxID=153491 RepID=A0A376BRX1_9NEIS|nr:nucleotidyltransferase domain-containing protein [Alysiella crassa]UOP07864.1 nucleotidyltransferase domain-containing protein [Alysiella crassa]SSY79747.1 Predicted nucleotidyltransferase [Alysiella crassa]